MVEPARKARRLGGIDGLVTCRSSFWFETHALRLARNKPDARPVLGLPGNPPKFVPPKPAPLLFSCLGPAFVDRLAQGAALRSSLPAKFDGGLPGAAPRAG